MDCEPETTLFTGEVDFSGCYNSVAEAFPWQTGLMGDKRFPELVSFLRDWLEKCRKHLLTSYNLCNQRNLTLIKKTQEQIPIFMLLTYYISSTAYDFWSCSPADVRGEFGVKRGV